ncbi:hypothetical protein [uncultured Sulfitobacter sp.]|uniref:hypothetical protein n=1 Tax=uncultured Sulfitobacter sp. TaxID=191468 RepID=UPI00261988C3|nr:hypothetical protein [uncultured Sulfitobacter sp.]
MKLATNLLSGSRAIALRVAQQKTPNSAYGKKINPVDCLDVATAFNDVFHDDTGALGGCDLILTRQ